MRARSFTFRSGHLALLFLQKDAFTEAPVRKKLTHSIDVKVAFTSPA